MTCEDVSLVEDECLISTRRLRLRPARMGDAPDIARYANDRQIAEMTSRIPHPYTLGNAEAFLASVEDELIMALERLSDGAFVGLCSLQAMDAPRTVELGYWIGRPFWGHGFGTEAAQAVIDHAFAGLDMEMVEVRCRVVNGASRRVIQKCGFGYCGTGLSVSLAAGRVASESYRMDRRCWQSLKSWSATG